MFHFHLNPAPGAQEVVYSGFWVFIITPVNQYINLVVQLNYSSVTMSVTEVTYAEDQNLKFTTL